MSKVNRNFKASVFPHLFADPDKELGLYNAFSQVHYSLGTPVTDLTLNDVLFKDRVNDLAFSGYVMFISKARAFEQSGMSREGAVKSAVEECIKQGILADYLQSKSVLEN